MIKVLLFSKYSQKGASSRLRTGQYVDSLLNDGVEVTTSNLFDDEYLSSLYTKNKKNIFKVFACYFNRLLTIFTVFRYDIIWIEKELFPFCPPIVECILMKLRVKYVVDYDDAIFHNYDLSKLKVVKFFLKRKIDIVMKYSSTVVCGNDYLADRALRAGAKNVIIIPTVIDLVRYPEGDKNKDCADVPITIGWIGSPSTQKYLVKLKSVFLELGKTHNFRLLLVGATSKILEDLRGVNIDLYDWSEASEVNNIKEMDIGIMPIEDGPWEKGKCGYKLIQYMACEVAVITSRVGANVDIVNYSNSGLLVDDNRAWLDSFSHLLENKEARATYGQCGRKAVVNKYSKQVQHKKLKEVFYNLYSI